MIYEVYLDDKLLYYPNDETYVIVNSKLDLALNEAGAFEFDVPSYNLRYDDFKLRKSMVQVKKDGVEIFYGEVREVTVNVDFTKHVYVVGELAFLFDSIQGQARYLTSPLEAMKSIIASHNSQVEDRKKFVLSEVSATDKDDQLYFYTNGEDTLTIIREKICNSLDGYIRVTKKDNVRYVSIVSLERFGTCTQEIQFGENLLNYSCNMSASDIATCVIPRGVKLNDEQRTKDAVDGLDEYLTIKGTSVDYYHKNIDNDYVQIDEAIANFGYVKVVKNWDKVTLKDNLKAKAIEWLKSAQYENMTLELNAIDLSHLDVNIEGFELGQNVHIWALPYGMDTNLPVRKKTIYLQELDKNEVVLGNSYRKSYTSQNSEVISLLKEEIPEESNVLKQAKQNALAMLADPTKGYLSYVLDEDGNRIAMEITDSKDSTKATRKWVWNASGLGYMKKTPSGEWDARVAITMDGRISADFITTGVMSADYIKGGTLEVGGKDRAKFGSIYVKDKEGNDVAKLSRDGLQMSRGYIALGNTFSVDDNGYMVATNARFIGSIESGSTIECGDNFYVDSSGALFATDGTFTGKIQAGSTIDCGDKFSVGEDGSVYIKNGTILVVDESQRKTLVELGESGLYLGAGSIALGENFYVDENGNMLATNATFTGSIESGSTITCGSNFSVDEDGKMYAQDGTFTGNIEGGTIKIGSNFTVDSDGTLHASGAEIDGDIDLKGTFAGNIVNGATINCGSNFSVDESGNMVASSARITGEIYSSKGTIGGFSIGANNLHVGGEGNGIWIFGGNVQGSPKGSVVVGEHGEAGGLIRIGYRHNGRIGILYEVDGNQKYFWDLLDPNKKI